MCDQVGGSIIIYWLEKRWAGGGEDEEKELEWQMVFPRSGSLKGRRMVSRAFMVKRLAGCFQIAFLSIFHSCLTAAC